MGNAHYKSSRMVISEELDLCPLTPIFQLPMERVREVAFSHIQAHEAMLSGAGKAAVEDQITVEELQEILDLLDLPEETHLEFLARFGLKPSRDHHFAAGGGRYEQGGLVPSASEQSGYRLRSVGKVDPHEIFISLLAVSLQQTRENVSPPLDPDDEDDDLPPPPQQVPISLQKRLEEKFAVMFAMKDPQHLGFLHRQGVLMLLAQLSKGVHRLAAFSTPSLTLLERFVERHNPEQDRWTPQDLAAAVVCEPYAAKFAENLTDPVDLRYIRLECKQRFDEVKSRVDALAKGRSKKEGENATTAGGVSRDPWQKRTTTARIEEIRRSLKASDRDTTRMTLTSGYGDGGELYDPDEGSGSEDDDLEEKEQGSDYDEEDTPLFELAQKEVAAIWRVIMPHTDMDAIQHAQMRAEYACGQAEVAFSKSSQDEAVREHPRYKFQQGTSSEDLPVIAAPAIAFEVLNMGNSSGYLFTHHYKHLRWLCAEICPTYRGVGDKEGELLPKDPTELFRASAWGPGDIEPLRNPLVLEEAYATKTTKGQHPSFSADPLPRGFRSESFVEHAASFALLRDRRDYEQKLREDFNKYDQDGSGTIERDEFESAIQELMFQFILPQTDQQKEMMEAVGKMLAEEVLFQVDEDNSGIIEYDEFKNGVRLIHKKFQEIRRVMGTSTSLMFVLEVIIAERTGRPVEKIE